jgi:hypothetical protein
MAVVKGDVNLNTKGILTRTIGNADMNSSHIFTSQTTEYTNGTSTAQVDAIYTVTNTMAGAADTIDLNGGTLEDVNGVTVTFDTIRLISIKNTGSIDIDISVDLGGSTTVAAEIHAGCDMVWSSPSNVQGTCGDATINGAAGAVYTFEVWGLST